MLNKILDYFDNDKPRPWFFNPSTVRDGMIDYKNGRQPCSNNAQYINGYNRLKRYHEYKLSYIERLAIRFTNYVRGE